MAQSNLAREPSMDEILASIRKIIESNETTGPGLPANDQGPLSDGYYASERPYFDEEEVEDIHLTIDDTVFSDFEDGTQTHEHRVMPVLAYPAAEPAPVVAPPAPAPASVSSSAPLSLADVAARVRAASERQSLPRDMPARPAAATPREAPAMTESPAANYVETPMRQVTERPPVRAEAEAPQEPRAAAPAPVQPTPEPVAPEPAEAEAPVEADMPAKDISAILSDAVSEQVSRSFGELALAVDSSPRRSFDEIAEEMLRPMLQEWLDDNLPTLVERLVREEIERVARGPRR